MPRVSQVIHQYGRPVKARLLDGSIVEREDKIYVPSYGMVYPCLDYDNHFVYYKKQLGSTLMCTCGSQAAAFGYDAYKKYCSYMGERVIGCIVHLQTGRHGDGSS
jgi:hypothetical protein